MKTLIKQIAIIALAPLALFTMMMVSGCVQREYKYSVIDPNGIVTGEIHIKSNYFASDVRADNIYTLSHRLDGLSRLIELLRRAILSSLSFYRILWLKRKNSLPSRFTPWPVFSVVANRSGYFGRKLCG